jgi:hypothetical protein
MAQACHTLFRYQPEARSQSETQEEVAREDAQVLLERICHPPFQADGEEFGDDQHDHRGQPGRPTGMSEHPSKPGHDTETSRRHGGHNCLQ